MSAPQVTLVVVPRERFSCTQASLESLYEHTQMPFNLVYVDGNSPVAVQRYLAEQAEQKQFQLIRTDYYLHPNQARNLGAAAVTTPYLVFVDNDVIVTPGWLQALVDCAEATGAAVVGPLMCQHEPVHTEIHFAGGETHIWQDKTGRRRLREKMYGQGKTVAVLQPTLSRSETELAEFHCVLVRTAVLARLGGLDEQMLNTKEHLDFCMAVRELGATVYFEPASLVTYVPGPPLAWSDLHYYMLRWSDAWTLASLHRLRDKWQLSEDAYFTTKYKKLGWRRKMTIIAPIIFRLTFGLYSPKLEKLMMWFEHRINRYLTHRHRLTQARWAVGESARSHPSLTHSPGSMPPAL
ncbi:MAG TPA: glycosyltransferase [Nodosilinea sp.]|nr:glycosyltransferase [Nodosilinea sp.]